MKRLKRRLSAAFRPHSAVVDNAPYHESGSFTGPPCHPMQLHTSHSVPSYLRSSSITLSDSISELAERLASEGVIMEESDGVTNLVQINGNGCDRGFRYDAPPSARYPYRSVSYHHGVDVHPEPPISTTAKVLMRPKKKQKEKEKEEAKKSNGRINSWHSSRCESNVGVGVGGPAGRRLSHVQYHHNGLFYGHHRAVVHEGSALGSDGESVEASPCTSDEVTSPERYVVNVKMRTKPTRRWSEQDIQKRLSLPADLRLPLSVVEKLNRTPTLDQPLTRKSRRASLSEIGFGKLETYQKLEKLGEGTYATVYKGRSRLTENYVALKEIRLEQEEGAPCTAIREVSLLRDLRHANVVTLHDIIHTERLLTLVFEYVDRDLKQYMDACGNIMSISNVRFYDAGLLIGSRSSGILWKYTSAEAGKGSPDSARLPAPGISISSASPFVIWTIFLIQLLRGLSYCHKRRVLHRDLKPQNLLINQNGELKLADFGLARAKSVPTKTYSHEVVTLWYRPPDVLLGATDYSTHIDMWGVGCILYEMVAGRPFFPGSSAEEQLHLIFRALGTPRPDVHSSICDSKEFKSYAFPRYHAEPLVNHAPRLDADGLDLLAKLLQYEGRKRISAADGMRHQFFRSLPLSIFDVPDNESIFTVPGLHLTRDPGTKSASSMMLHGSRPGKNRRQSMLL